MSKIVRVFCTLILVLSFVGVSIQSVSSSLDDPFDYDPPDYDLSDADDEGDGWLPPAEDDCIDAECNSDCEFRGLEGGSCTAEEEGLVCTCDGVGADDSDDSDDTDDPCTPNPCGAGVCCDFGGAYCCPENAIGCGADINEGCIYPDDLDDFSDDSDDFFSDDSDDSGCAYPCSSDSDCDAVADPEHPSTAACVGGCCVP